METLFSIEAQTLRYVGVKVTVKEDMAIPKGITTVIGNNGSGKSALAAIIEGGRNFMTNKIITHTPQKPRIEILAFSNLHILTGMKAEYYQQRYESMNDEVPTVAETFADKLVDPEWRSLIDMLGLTASIDKHLNYLSSGELRKLLIANALYERPDLLVLDNPYIGLDANARATVVSAISNIADKGTSIMLLVCDPKDIHTDSDAVIVMEEGCVTQSIYPKIEGMTAFEYADETFDYDRETLEELLRQNPLAVGEDRPNIVEMHDCVVKYGSKTLVEKADWTIKQGECWALQGANGSGKSTLLSLINADNPQAYSNDIRLWGKKRGSGESIWDIKRRIGFVSAEKHLYFHSFNDTVAEIITRALRDTPSDFSKLPDDKQRLMQQWLRVFKWQDKADCVFRNLSFGQQRLVLLMTALVKMPELLILDEPLHGLDAGLKKAVVEIVEGMSRRGTTIIYVTHDRTELPSCVSHTKRI